MVHHKYSHYLLGETHRECDSLKHAEIVTKLLPEFGEAYINCAEACLGIGDTRRALAFAEKASAVPPSHINPVTYEYMVSKAKWQWFLDIGDISSAEIWFNKCYELAQKKPLCDDKKLKNNLEHYRSDPDVRQHARQLASLRQKEFGAKLNYRIPSLNIEICFPGDWKIDKEYFSGDAFIAIFTPTSNWDETAQCPCDASVTVLYSTRQNEMTLDVEVLGTQVLKSMRPAGKTKSILVEGPKTFNEITFCSWNFKIAGSWPKEGILITFALPTCRMQIHAMCQSCGKHIFWTILTSVVEAFTQNLLHNPNWKLKE
jgi:hypothetical protein